MQKEQVFEKILVPVDGSFPSLMSQELAAFLAKKFNSKVTVLHIVSHELLTPSIGEWYPEWDVSASMGTTGGELGGIVPRRVPGLPSQRAQQVTADITNWYHQKGTEIVDNAVALFKGEGIPVDQKLVQHKDPAETIIHEAEKGKYSLIVMGYSEEEKKEPHLGGVAEKVSHHSKTPVLLTLEKKQVSKILVPIDGSESAKKALQQAVLLSQATGATMTLLYVQESGLFKLKPDVAKTIGTRILSKAAEQAKGIKLDQKLDSGDPAQVINQTADKGNYDLIVMGSRGHGGIERFLLGSVSNHVIHYAKNAVLLIR